MSPQPAAAERRAAGSYAALAALGWLGGTALLCLLATVVVAGSTSHYGAAAAGQAMLWLLGSEVLAAAGALGLYAAGLRRRGVPWWGLWWAAVVLAMLLGLAMLGFVTLVLFNR